MRSTILGGAKKFAVLTMAVIGLVTAGVTAAPAQAAATVRVNSQITAHNLPYLNSPYIEGSVLTAGRSVSVECYIRGREYVGNSIFWYRISTRYYPAYAFAVATGIPQCGGPTNVPLAANGYSSPSFDAPAASGWFTSNENVQAVCVAAGQTVNGSDLWYFVKGYFLHASRLRTRPDLYTCRGFRKPGAVSGVIAAATAMLGKYPYSWGGGNQNGPTYGICCSPSGRDDSDVYGFDCSGFTQYAFYRGAGINVGGDSRTQYANGYRVALAQRVAGDMIFWSNSSHSPSAIHHVALYVGNGAIIEATAASSGPDIRRRSFSPSESGVMPYVVRPIR
ncbi:C40 family peptidase [Plantactinospora sp. CA-290183]|uniref:C40 family peptidase n=1 Tax=Plantactinospora sp. CA-290183 TaxID=3240006 RepID=UPI003D90EC7A